VRTGRTRLRLPGADRAPLAWEALLGSPTAGGVAERAGAVDRSGEGRGSRGKAAFPARLVVLGLAPAAAARAARSQRRRQDRCRPRRPPQPPTVRATGHPMPVAPLPAAVPAPGVLEAYRLRRQVEPALKRLETLPGPGRPPARGEALARSRLPAHLIAALPIEGTSRRLPDCRPPPAAPRRRTSLRRVTQALRDALPVAIRGVPGIAAPLAAAAMLDQRLHERCHRRRTSRFDEARRHGRA